MHRLSRVLLVVAVLAVVAGAVYFAVSDIPPPTARVEKVIPDARLPR